MYPHSATPRIPIQSHTTLRLARPHFHHLTQTHTRHTYTTSIPPNTTPESTQPTRPDPRPYQKPSVHYPTNRHTLPPPNQTHSLTSTRPSYPTIPIYYRTLRTLTLLPLYAHPAAKTLIIPSKAHMSLRRFCCTLTIEYKCKTSHIINAYRIVMNKD